MRLSSLLLSVIALAAPLLQTHALSAQSTLARLSQRLAQAETTLQQLQSQVDTGYGAASVTYTFDNSAYTDTTKTKTVVRDPVSTSNIVIVSNSVRKSTVLSRAASTAQSKTAAKAPVSLPANQPFTLGIWVNWIGYFNPGAGNSGTILSAANDNILLQVGAGGVINAAVGGASLANVGTITAGNWFLYELVWDSTNTLTVYQNGNAVGTAAGSSFPGATELILLNNAARTSGFVGSVDQLATFPTAFDDTDAAFYYSDQVSAVGKADVASTWFGHTSTSSVSFQNVVEAQPTGDIKLTGAFTDIEFRASNQIQWQLYGVTGLDSMTGVDINYQGTKGVATWDASQSILVFQPAADFVTVPKGSTWSFTIPASAFNLVNPNTQKLATANDGRWMISVFWLDLDQTPGKTRRQGLQWQPISFTPATFNDKAL